MTLYKIAGATVASRMWGSLGSSSPGPPGSDTGKTEARASGSPAVAIQTVPPASGPRAASRQARSPS